MKVVKLKEVKMYKKAQAQKEAEVPKKLMHQEEAYFKYKSENVAIAERWIIKGNFSLRNQTVESLQQLFVV